MNHRRRSPGRSTAARLAAVLLALSALLPAAPAAAAEGLTISAQALLRGHVRAGAWFAIAVDLANDGPAVSGELRVTGGLDARTRFGTPVEVATQSRKRHFLYAQPPGFGGTMLVQLVAGGAVVAETKIAIALHDRQQLVVGVVAENPARLVAELDLLTNQAGSAPTIVALAPEDLPERIQAWSAIDRLVWQDAATSRLTPGQLEALRTWVAAGGRLVIAGGTAGTDTLAALPDELLPYRPDSLLDLDPEQLRSFLGGLPDDARPLVAASGTLLAGRTLAAAGDRVVAADRRVGSGTVTLLGFDPTTGWLAAADELDVPLWRRLLPGRSAPPLGFVDDSMIASAVTTLPSLAVPPIGGLLVLLLGYVVLVGPVNYLLLRRIDRREWAWATIPALTLAVAAGAFGIGATLRGTDVVLHEVAVVRGAVGSDRAVVQAYLGLFSPDRRSFDLRLPGDTLVASPMNGDLFGSSSGTSLDVLQGDPSTVRALDVGFGSMRTVRAEGSASAPLVDADLRVEGGALVGSVTNRSDRVLVDPAVVLGLQAVKLRSLGPGERADVRLPLTGDGMMGMALADRIVGPFNWGGPGMTEEDQRKIVRRTVVEQLSVDEWSGGMRAPGGDAALVLAWGTDPVLDVEIGGTSVRRQANVLYAYPVRVALRGPVVLAGDLLVQEALDVGANFFSKDPWTISLGTGAVRMAWRPIPFEGRLEVEEILVALTFGGELAIPPGEPVPLVEAERCEPGGEGCLPNADGLPEIEIRDVRTGAWVQFARPVLGVAHFLPNPARWIDPGSGELQVRFVNERADGIGFQFPLRITGTVR